MSIVVVGSVGIDFTAVAERLPQVGETVLANQFHIGPGGKGFNQAVGAARLGGEVRFATRTGRGDLGAQARRFLEAEGLRGDLILETDTDNQVALILVDRDGANMISVTPGASAELLPADVAGIQFEPDDILLGQLETPIQTFLAAARRARAAGARVVLNPAPAGALPDELYGVIDVATPNETELALLTGLPASSLTEIETAAGRLIERGVGEVIVTIGSRGVLHVTGDASTHHPALVVDAVDTTGAGDAFNAGLVVGLASSSTMAEAIRLGADAGSYCVTRLGVLDGLATRSALDEFVELHR